MTSGQLEVQLWICLSCIEDTPRSKLLGPHSHSFSSVLTNVSGFPFSTRWFIYELEKRWKGRVKINHGSICNIISNATTTALCKRTFCICLKRGFEIWSCQMHVETYPNCKYEQTHLQMSTLERNTQDVCEWQVGTGSYFLMNLQVHGIWLQ